MNTDAFVIRPMQATDLDWLIDIAQHVGIGFTSIQNNKEYLAKRVETVVKSFAEQIPIEKRIFIFVRENADGQRVGISGIDIDVGHRDMFYNYQISTVTQGNKKLNIFIDHKILRIVNNFQEASELISFWIDPKFRHMNFGKSLSFCRFLFIAEYANFFGNEIIAEIRGVIDEHDRSPFWEAIGRKFFKMDFNKADALSNISKQFIGDLVSREPIYIDLLPQEAKAVIGMPHFDSAPAQRVLEEQGFKFSNHVDIFDAGPLMSAQQDQIKILSSSKGVKVAKIVNKIESTIEAMLFNARLAVRITVAKITVNDNGDINLDNKTAEILQITVGDPIRYVIV